MSFKDRKRRIQPVRNLFPDVAILVADQTRNLRLNDTGEISPLKSGLWRGSLSRSGSPFGLELMTSMTSKPVARTMEPLLDAVMRMPFPC